jgi:hypothetical protein
MAIIRAISCASFICIMDKQFIRKKVTEVINNRGPEGRHGLRSHLEPLATPHAILWPFVALIAPCSLSWHLAALTAPYSGPQPLHPINHLVVPCGILWLHIALQGSTQFLLWPLGLLTSICHSSQFAGACHGHHYPHGPGAPAPFCFRGFLSPL